LLKRIAYFTELYEWKGLKKLYAHIIRQIENGLADWSKGAPFLQNKESGQNPAHYSTLNTVWPQSKLQFEYAGSKINFDDLEFNSFVAGELEIMSSSKIRTMYFTLSQTKSKK
jgi:hypothetical protein